MQTTPKKCDKNFEISGEVKMTTIVQEIKDIIEDARQIESATGYGECLYHQNRCDSSIRRYKRMEFVKQAEAEFIEANKKEILKNAAKLCRESIGDISELITLK